jgi:hypothetical protein
MAANAEGRPRTESDFNAQQEAREAREALVRRAQGTELQRQQLIEAAAGDDELGSYELDRVRDNVFMAIPPDHAARVAQRDGRDNPLQLQLQQESEQPQQPEHDPLENPFIYGIQAQNSLRNPPANGGQKKKQTRKNSKKYKNKKYKNKNRKHRQTRKTKKRNTIRK